MKVRVLGVPMDLGQSRRGVDMGPSAIRYAGLAARLSELGHEVADGGNIEVCVRDTLAAICSADLVTAIAQSCQLLYQEAKQTLARGDFPLFLGGDHSLAIGTIGGVSHAGPCGVIWVDAHGDINTPESSPSGNVHGMPLAALLGQGFGQLVDLGRPGPKLTPAAIVLIGLRDLDPGEQQRLKQSGIQAFTMRDIDEQGMGRVARQTLDHLSGYPRIHLSLDMDGLDPSEAPGVGTPVRGGISYREGHLLMETLADSGAVASADIVEINPILDIQNRTAEMAVGLAASLLGQRIL